MRRGVVLTVLCLTFLVLGVGVALAGTQIACPGGDCPGTSGPDMMVGTDGDDAIAGFGGRDKITDHGKQDVDSITGGRDNDTIDVREGNSGLINDDFVHCGAGNDTVFFDKGDTVVGCEKKNPS
jgi:Ca2+-binding RTX toxin-like protein